MPEPLGSFAFTWPFYAAAVAGYLLGSVPFGLILTRLAGLGDVRHIGSGNIGATNVLRTGHKGLATATLLLDGGKGAAAALLGKLFGPDIMVLAAAGAFIGHLYPLYLGFRGGKGVATFVGIMLAVSPLLGGAICLVWTASALAFRYSSLAALIAALAAPPLGWLLVSRQIGELALFFLFFIVWRHRTNIGRLIRGDEPKIGADSQPAP